MAKKIMLVEDDNNLREIYEARLSAEGYEIVAAENGEAALAMAAKERPDMIISDVMMPKISGFEMLDILRNTDSLKNTKIIMLTALGQSEDSQRADSLGADRYLVKSQVTLEDIVKAAHDLLDDPNKLAAVPDAAVENVIAPEPIAETAETAEAPAAAEPVTEAAPVAEVAEAPAAPAPVSVTEPTPEPVAMPGSSIVEPTSVPAPTEDIAGPIAPVAETATQTPNPITENPDPAIITPTVSLTSDVPSEPTAPAPSIISIPVTDANGDGTQPATTDIPADTPPASTASPAATDIQVVEPPVEGEPETATQSPAPGPETDANAAEANSVTSETPQTESIVAPEPTVADPAVQTSAIEEQINAFINQGAEAPAAAEPVAEPAPLAEPAASEQITQPSVQIPSVVASPSIDTSSGPDISDADLAAGPADNVPAPEQLNSFVAPVIDAPEGATVPEPQDVPVTQPTADTAADANNADQLREAAAGLADAASTEAAQAAAPSSTATNRMRTITPVTPAENKPTIHQLLELEEAKNSASQAAQATQTPTPNVDAYNPSTQPAPEQPPQNNQPIDPNSISL